MNILLDTGPWVALLCKNERHHAWACEQFAQHPGPFITCEAVVAETCFLLARAGFDAGVAMAFIERGAVQIGLRLEDQATAVRKLYQRYQNVPSSLADACLIRLSEMVQPSAVLTLDSDFRIYRRNGRQVIPVICP